MPSKKLFLLDAFALIYRAHFAFSKNPRITSKGMDTGAIFGFTNTLLEVLKKENPSHLAVCFDTKDPTFRHTAFTDYKANREEQPESITIAIPYIKRLVKAFNLACIEKEGYEADDIIGTLAKKAVVNDFEVYMYTPDKDYGQLVEEHILLYKPAFLGNGVEVQGISEILNKWNISKVDQVIDILGLMGDKVDNIPGIPGVGEKTAAKLLSEYNSLENILENANKIPGKLGEKIRLNKESALMSKMLATINTQTPIDFSEDELIVKPINTDDIAELFDELEFRTLKNRVLGITGERIPGEPAPKNKTKTDTPPSQMSLFTDHKNEEKDGNQTKDKADTIDTIVHDYYLIATKEERTELLKYLMIQEEVCFDTETTDLDTIDADIVGLAFSYKAKEGFYVPIPQIKPEAQAIMEEFRPFFENENIRKIAQNLKYDIGILANFNIEVKGQLYDTMLAHYLLEPEQRHGMDLLAKTYLNYQPVSIETLIGKKGIKQGNMKDAALEDIKEYAAEDADITFQLKQKLDLELQQRNQQQLLLDVETPLVKVLSKMERTGVNLDVHALKELSAILQQDLAITQSEIFELAGTAFNVASPKQLGEVLFEHMKIDPKPKKTATGQYATGEDILTNYEAEHKIASKILDYRELSKLKNTYVDALPQLISKKDGRIHTSYNQAVAATGRLSSTNPNLQNIPIRTARGREIRKAFIPTDSNYLILSADYSQIELRIMAALSGDLSMIEAFEKNIDIHSTTAAKVFGVGLSEVTSDMRRKAKMVNFGIIYGISAFGLAQRLSISRTEAKDIIDSYFSQFSQVKSFMDKLINNAREHEYVETILGRRRYLKDIRSNNQTQRGYAERNAINAPIQGSAADMIKIAMIQIDDFMIKEKLKSKMILQVHDELVFDAHLSEIDLLKQKVDHIMVNAIQLQVKMETGMGIGKNWLEAH